MVPRRDEQLGGDVACRGTADDEAGDLQLMGREQAMGDHLAFDMTAGSPDLGRGAIGEQVGADPAEQVDGDVEVLACVGAPPEPAQLLAPGQAGAALGERVALLLGVVDGAGEVGVGLRLVGGDEPPRPLVLVAQQGVRAAAVPDQSVEDLGALVPPTRLGERLDPLGLPAHEPAPEVELGGDLAVERVGVLQAPLVEGEVGEADRTEQATFDGVDGRPAASPPARTAHGPRRRRRPARERSPRVPPDPASRGSRPVTRPRSRRPWRPGTNDRGGPWPGRRARRRAAGSRPRPAGRPRGHRAARRTPCRRR